MLQAHSYLWHYLWVAPNAILLFLAFLMWKRGQRKQFPAFLVFAFLGPVVDLAVYAADVLPSVTPEAFWRVVWAGLIVEGPLKFVLVGEIFANTFGSYASLARFGRISIRLVGVLLVLASAVAAAYAPQHSLFGIVSGAHLLEQTIYLIEAGLLVFLFLFSLYFHLTMSRLFLGIALGLGISACVHLGTWAVLANATISDPTRSLFDFLNMATYHLCVLIWCYYLLVPRKIAAHTSVPLPDANLDLWNRELERLLPR